MKKHKKAGRRLFLLSAAGYFTASVSVMLLPLTAQDEERVLPAFQYAIGIMFWFGILMGTLIFLLTWMKVKNDTGYKKIKEQQRAGWLSFFKNRAAIVVDIILIVTWIITLIGNFYVPMPDILLLPVMFLALYSFCMHFLLNGRVYSYISINNKHKKEKKHEEQI